MLPQIQVAESRVISKVDLNPKCIVLLVAAYSSSTDIFSTQRLLITVKGGATEVDYTFEPKISRMRPHMTERRLGAS